MDEKPSIPLHLPVVGVKFGNGRGRLGIGGVCEPVHEGGDRGCEEPGAANIDELLALVVAEMEEAVEKDFTTQDFARLARSAQLYQRAVGTEEDGKKETIRRDGLGKDERALAQDLGYMTDSQASSFGKIMTKQVGTEHVIGGRHFQFGKREQARKRTYTVKLI